MAGCRQRGGRALSAIALSALIASLVPGCTHRPPPVVHTVQPGENLFRIARYYGVSVSELVETNRISDVTDVAIGTRLAVRGPRHRVPPARPLRPPIEARAEAEADALVHGGLQFAWPVRGRITSRFGRRGRRPHDGLDIATRRGSLVRAAEAGRIVFSGRMGAYGKAVVIRHSDAYATVYAHHRKNRVSKGGFVDKGAVVGEVGTTGNATGPHLHFELHRDEIAQDPLLFLP